ncbi:GDP-mannose 4,6-dehydratase [Asticcacaulis sp. BYS171W]|uniref:GDP-mannose 4,6-dehydratase n=1 Tax=Asticcacaulis aquaticus TaxID=2984212 RepID=A0ABT5HSR1_9CAUL|nr:GDP-mannose 4,6-dehydratase [Asticcacaulis aquaticus]MDC7682880.1 GDP-mannose 4,6-dehydratase [Asticcacaulis aquaticus]
MSKRVLVTGIGGFAGSYVSADLAAHGYEIVGLTSSTPIELAGVTKVFQINLLDADGLKRLTEQIRPTHVIHLAAISFVGHGNVGEIYDTNIMGTRNLLSALAALPDKPQSVLLTSSANIYGNSDMGFLSETDAVNPANDYAVSKVAMEYMARQFQDILNIVIARPFNYTGVGQSTRFLVPKIVEHFRARSSFIELGNTDVARDFSDVRMVTQALRALIETSAAAGQIYNICSGRPYSLEYIIDTCAQITGHRMEVKVNPAFVRQNEIKLLAGNPEKFRKEIGQFDDYPFERTLEWMLT